MAMLHLTPHVLYIDSQSYEVKGYLGLQLQHASILPAAGVMSLLGAHCHQGFMQGYLSSASLKYLKMTPTTPTTRGSDAPGQHVLTVWTDCMSSKWLLMKLLPWAGTEEVACLMGTAAYCLPAAALMPGSTATAVWEEGLPRCLTPDFYLCQELWERRL